MEILLGHTELGIDAVEAEIQVALGEAHGEVQAGSLAVDDPFVHPEEMAVLQIQTDGIDDLGDDGELFRGADGAADAHRAVIGGLLPGIHIFQRFRRIEFLGRVVDVDLETGPFVAFQRVDGDLGRFVQNLAVQGRVVPPAGGQFACCSRFHVSFLS